MTAGLALGRGFAVDDGTPDAAEAAALGEGVEEAALVGDGGPGASGGEENETDQGDGAVMLFGDEGGELFEFHGGRGLLFAAEDAADGDDADGNADEQGEDAEDGFDLGE